MCFRRLFAIMMCLASFSSALGADHLLWIGDSHSGANRMSARYFELWPKTASWFSVSGATARHWWRGDFRGLHFGSLRFLPRQGDRSFVEAPAPQPAFSFDDLVRSEKPTHIVFALGTNDAVVECRVPVTPQSYPVRLAARARALGLKCLWVAPTLQNWDDTGRLNHLVRVCGEGIYTAWIRDLKRAIENERCLFFDSSRLRISRSVQPQDFSDCLTPKSDLWLPDDGEKLHFRSVRAYAQWTGCLLLSPEWSQFSR